MNEDGTKARGIIAVIAVTALVTLSTVLIFVPPPTGSKEVLLLVVGALIAFCADVKQFYFGSSSGAKVMVQNAQKITEAAVDAAAKSLPPTVIVPTLGAPVPTGVPGDPVSVSVEAGRAEGK